MLKEPSTLYGLVISSSKPSERYCVSLLFYEEIAEFIEFGRQNSSLNESS